MEKVAKGLNRKTGKCAEEQDNESKYNLYQGWYFINKGRPRFKRYAWQILV